MPAYRVVLTNPGDSDEAAVWGACGSLITSLAFDHQTYLGNHWQVHVATATAAAAHTLQIHTGASTALGYYMRWRAGQSSAGTWQLIEAATLASTGAVTVYPQCANRNSPTYTTSDFVWGSAVSNTNAVLYEANAYDANKFTNANAPDAGAGWWLAADTDYLVQFVAATTANVDIHIDFVEKST